MKDPPKPAKRRYGTRRRQVALREKGPRVGRQRLRTAMRRWNLHTLQPNAYTPRTTDSELQPIRQP